jgi:hypothetical protein
MSRTADAWAAAQDAGRGYAPRVMRADHPAALMARLTELTGTKLSAAAVKSARRVHALHTEAGRWAGFRRQEAEQAVKHWTKAQRALDAETLIGAIDKGVTDFDEVDFGPSNLAEAEAVLEEAKRIASATVVAVKGAEMVLI